MNEVVDGAERSDRHRASCKPIKNIVGLALGTHLAEIVHSHIPTKAAAMKRLGETASHVVLFQDQHRVTGLRQCRSAGQAADPSGSAIRSLIPNHRKLLRSKDAMGRAAMTSHPSADY
jgi:hypothetical protein